MVEIEAFEETDARDMLQDSFGAGSAGDIEILQSKIQVVEVEQSPFEV